MCDDCFRILKYIAPCSHVSVFVSSLKGFDTAHLACLGQPPPSRTVTPNVTPACPHCSAPQAEFIVYFCSNVLRDATLRARA